MLNYKISLQDKINNFNSSLEFNVKDNKKIKGHILG